MAELLKDSNGKKAKRENDISLKLIEENINLFSSVLYKMVKFYIDKTYFPNSFK